MKTINNKGKLMKKGLIIFLIFLTTTTLVGCGKNNKKHKVRLGNGGVYKSTDGGETFFSINHISEEKTLSTSSILDIVIDPNNSKVIYVGTNDKGIYRSADGGKSWAESKSDFTYVRRIELDPTNPKVIYIIAESKGEMALFKTVDGGINWQRLLLQRDKQQPIVLDVLLDKKNPQIVYASDTTGGIYKSIDGGEKWKAIYWGEFPTVGIVMDSQNNQRLYFVTANQQIYITEDGGEKGKESFKVAETGGPIYSVAVSKFEEGTVYVLFTGGLYVSRDGGNSFQLIPSLLKPDNTVANMVVADSIDKNVLYIIAGKVIYKTDNGGNTWRAIPLNGVKWPVSQFEVSHDDNQMIYLGTRKPSKSGGSGIPFLKF
jgi:photosystem II stability/assembly factor-like uncharacterized protein